ncbi:hypothetical protein Tco_1006972 [Tanacetum coccineum]|uniref:Uncharacterized protein n=1 Tax=Tanacetum coccineum TaxID=301880 RepID=A0ABQ5FKD5_9ASTR
MNVPVPLDHFPVNALTSKVFSFMVKKGKHFSGKVTPLFASMLVQPTEDEGTTSERPSEPQQHYHPYPSSPKTVLVGIMEVTDQAKEIKHLKAQIKKLKKKAKPVITHHRAWMKSVSLKQRLAGKKSLKSNWMQNDSVSKQGRKSAKAEPSVHKDPLFDELPEDTLDYMETEDAKKREDKRCSIVVKLKKEGYSNNNYFHTVGDDETIAQVLLNMSQAKAVSREKEKGVELKDVEVTERPRPTSTRSLLTLKPLPKIELQR